MHEPFLLAALEQAWLGRGQCAPNPSVGAVAVQNNEIIAQSWHQGAGSLHAEQRLIAALVPGLTDVSLYVTLEPCNHWGRTPPCVDHIINYGIKRVVYGYKDPNRIVMQNNTPALLEAAGIEVIHAPLPEINAFYTSYYHWTKTAQPWVTVKLAHTFDGKIAYNKGRHIWLSNQRCQDFTHRQRRASDLLLTSARTILADNPSFNVRLAEQPPHGKPVAILDRTLCVTAAAQIFKSATVCHLFYDERVSVTQPISNCHYHPVPVQDDKLDLHVVMRKLGHLGYHDVWVEVGGSLFSALHRAGLVQRTYLYQVPQVLGEAGLAGLTDPNFFVAPHSIQWQAMDNNMLVTIEWQKVQCLPV